MNEKPQLNEKLKMDEEQNPYQKIDTTIDTSTAKYTLIFRLDHFVGALEKVLMLFTASNLNMTKIESRPSREVKGSYDFYVDFPAAQSDIINKVSNEIKQSHLGEVILVSAVKGTIWFPRTLSDLDQFATKSLDYGAEIKENHPAFGDEVYKKRRKEITDLAASYKTGQPLPNVEYTAEEKGVWKIVYTNLKKYRMNACSQYREIFPYLEHYWGLCADEIPQISVISEHLHRLTGWRLKPVTGLLTSRDFLNAFAFRVFHSTQYIRHASKPMYTPEPDICHEILGHVPLLADPEFADFSQEIGLASLGATDEDILKLSTLYWFTVEFGLCKENGEVKAYGAGLLSSFGELQYCLEDKGRHEPFQPDITALTKYDVTKYQEKYFVTESFADATKKLKEYAAKLDRPFSVRYNPLTECIDVLDEPNLVRFAKSIRNDLSVIIDALEKKSH